MHLNHAVRGGHGVGLGGNLHPLLNGVFLKRWTCADSEKYGWALFQPIIKQTHFLCVFTMYGIRGDLAAWQTPLRGVTGICLQFWIFEFYQQM